jgi:hypothetical protein
MRDLFLDLTRANVRSLSDDRLDDLLDELGDIGPEHLTEYGSRLLTIATAERIRRLLYPYRP